MDWSLTILDEEGDISFVIAFNNESDALEAREQFLTHCPDVDGDLVSVGRNAELADAIEFYQ